MDASLSLALPLSLTHLVLPIGFLLNKFVNLLLEVVFVTFGLFVILLKLNDLLASRVLLSLLKLRESLLSGERSVKKLFISFLSSLKLDLLKLQLVGIMVDELTISFFVEDKTLSFSLSIGSFLSLPLSLQHILFFLNFLPLNLLNRLALLNLPSKNVHRVFDALVLLDGFFTLTLSLLLTIEHPQLGIDLLFSNGVLKFRPLVQQLLFTLKLATSDHELSFLLTEIVSFHFEFALVRLVDGLLPLDITLLLDLAKTVSHFCPHLLRSLQRIHKFDFVLLVLRRQQGSQLGTTIDNVGFVSLLQVRHPVASDSIDDLLVSFLLPLGLLKHVLLTHDC